MMQNIITGFVIGVAAFLFGYGAGALFLHLAGLI